MCSLVPDGQSLATVSEDGTLRLWELQGRQLAEFKHGSSRLFDLSFSADGQFVATASENQGVKVWAVEALSLDKLPKDNTYNDGRSQC